jgi:hypothetical protein
MVFDSSERELLLNFGKISDIPIKILIFTEFLLYFSKLQISPQYTYKLGSTPRAGAGAGAGAASWSWCACAGAASWCASMENESWMRCELDALELDAEENVRDR